MHKYTYYALTVGRVEEERLLVISAESLWLTCKDKY